MTSERDRAVLAAFNAVAVLLIVSPAIDVIGSVLPLRFGEVSWRFGTFGLLANALVSPILGLAILLLVASLTERRGTVRLVTSLTLLLAVLVGLGLGLFVLDYLQLRGAVSSASRTAYDSAAMKALLNGLLETLVLVWLVITGFGQAGTGGKHRRQERLGLLVQTPPDAER